jgi:DNA-binding transcriptional ArsR family regulator
VKESNIRLDSRAVRVLAHPLRARLLSELRVNGNATATVLASRLATNTGATSYHLRKLAEVNLVVETDEGRGKQRVWAAAQQSHSWTDGDFPGDPDAVAASTWLQKHYWAYLSERVAHWEDVRGEWPVEWRDATGSSDMVVELTAPRLRAMTAEIEEVIRRHQEAASAEPDPAARRITFLYYAMPTEPESLP